MTVGMEGLRAKALIRTLLVFFFVVKLVLSQCNIFELRGCVAHFEAYINDALVLFSDYSEEELNDLCRSHSNVNTCVNKIRSECTAEVTKQWQGIDDAFTFVCNEGKSVYLRNRHCFSNNTVISRARFCKNTLDGDHERISRASTLEDTEAVYANEADYKRDLCRVMKSFVDCMIEAASICGVEVEAWQRRVSITARQPELAIDNCSLRGSNMTACPAVLTTLILFIFVVIE